MDLFFYLFTGDNERKCPWLRAAEWWARRLEELKRLLRAARTKLHITLLMDRLQGGKKVSGRWPRHWFV
jgi:hypothetical protein